MRWTDFAAAMPPHDYSRVLNLFTAGRGYAYLAARSAGRNREAGSVVRYLDDAIAHLWAVQQQFEGSANAAAPSGCAAPHRPNNVRWRSFLATRSPQDAVRLSTALTDALIYARRLAEVIHEDGDFEWARQRLDTLLAVLYLARQLCELLVTV